MKKFNIYGLVILFSSLAILSGCMTSALHDNDFSKYKDTFSSVLISNDKKTLVAITKKYHYIFSTSQDMGEVLTSSAHKNISADVFTFTLDKGNVMTGNVRLCLSSKASNEDINAVASFGFKQENKFQGYCSVYALKGIRYRAGKTVVGQAYQLNKPYTVDVNVKYSPLKKGIKIAITPITAAIDGTLLIAGSPLIAFYIFAFYNTDSNAWAH